MLTIPALNRRRLLLGLAAASAGAAATAVATSATAGIAATAEAQEGDTLLALGEELPVFEKGMVDAMENYRALVREWSPQWPTAPKEIHQGYVPAGDYERDFDGVCLDDDGKPTYGHATNGRPAGVPLQHAPDAGHPH